MNNLLLKIPKEYWAYISLVVWGILSTLLMHKTPYEIDEGAAHALLLVWSVVDNLASTIFTLGMPDFRTLFFVPVGVLFTGNVFAAKVTAIIVMFIVAWSMHAWRCRAGEGESALIATGMLLISPLVQNQIDSIAVVPFLFFAIVIGSWADHIYRESPRPFGALYFSQLIISVVCTTLHPMGIAYPLALLWRWYKYPLDKSQQEHFFIGISAAVLFALVMTLGWSHVLWFMNPIKALAGIFLDTQDSKNWVQWPIGIVMAGVVLLVLRRQVHSLGSDMLGVTLLTALPIGLATGDAAFSMVALVISLYWGLPLLMPTVENPSRGFWGQRGIVLILTFVLSTLFMVIDRIKYESLRVENLSARGNLIKTLAGYHFENTKAEESFPEKPTKKQVRIASQWPALTMLACRCDVLPLPPDAKDSNALFVMLHGIDFLVFDPHNSVNSKLSYNLATMEAGRVETVAVKPGGVVVQIKNRTPVSGG